jgi:hypothetical protein
MPRSIIFVGMASRYRLANVVRFSGLSGNDLADWPNLASEQAETTITRKSTIRYLTVVIKKASQLRENRENPYELQITVYPSRDGCHRVLEACGRAGKNKNTTCSGAILLLAS